MALAFRLHSIPIVFCMTLLLTGCAAVLPDGTSAQRFFAAAASAPATLTPTPIPTATPEPVTFPLQARSAGEPLNARTIFAQVSPAVAFVETAIGTGSAVYIEPGYLLTNAHVVWPYLEARIAFPDGVEYESVPVAAWDLMADLALLGPIDHGIQPLALIVREDLEIGSQLYLIGYPGEVERFPQPTLVQGILSRVRNWAPIDLDFFQIDASIAGGQSGGAVISDSGEVLGIVSYYFTDAGFGLTPVAGDIVPRLNALMASEDAGLQSRRFLETPAVSSYQGRLPDAFMVDTFLLSDTESSAVELSVSGPGAPYMEIWDLFSEELTESEAQRDGSERAEVRIRYDAPYLVYVWQDSRNENAYELNASEALIPIDDPDDEQRLAVGESVAGAVDIPGDIDRYNLSLEKGDRIVVTAESLLVDPFLILIYEGATLEEVVADDDSGPQGLFGLNAELVYDAPRDGEYILLVSDASGYDIGGYIITIRQARAGERVTEAQVRNDLLPSAYGRLLRYEGIGTEFQILYPADWVEVEDPETECGPGVVVCMFGGPGAGLMITEEDLANTFLEDVDLNGYTDSALELIEESASGFELIAREPYTTLQGLQAETALVEVQRGRIRAKRFFFVDDDNHAFNIAVLVDTDDYDAATDLIDFLFESFRFWAVDDLEADPVWHFDEGIQLLAEQEVADALAAFDRALALNPDFAQAYLGRVRAYREEGDTDRLLADLERYIALTPDEADGLQLRASIYWLMNQYDLAAADLERAFAIDPEDVQLYNMRALVQAAMGESEEALATLAIAAEATGDLPGNVRDTLAYVYLLQDDIDAAAELYAELLAEDFQSNYTLMGAGIAYVRDGDPARGIPLIERGYAGEVETEEVDPQLSDLLRWSREILDAQ